MARPLRTAVLLLAALSPGCAAAAPDPIDNRASGQGVFLAYENVEPGPDQAARIPKLRLSIGGGDTFPVVMDTGSTGIVVSADRIPDVDTLPSRPGRLTYSSSGRIMIGRWVTTPVRIVGRNGQEAEVKPLRVLAVDRIACTARARNCRPDERPRGVAMMGVGFGRESDGQTGSTPDTNPFLNLAPSQLAPSQLAPSQGGGALQRGYIVTRAGVYLGPTGPNARDAFHLIKLQPHPGIPGEWNGVPVCIAVEGRGPPQCGRALIDTGIDGMFLTLPRASGSAADGDDEALPDGTRLSFSFTDDPARPAAAHYDLTVGDASSPLAPRTFHLNTTRPAPFVNTGVRFLNGFDVLYDADGGYYGFRPRAEGAATP